METPTCWLYVGSRAKLKDTSEWFCSGMYLWDAFIHVGSVGVVDDDSRVRIARVERYVVVVHDHHIFIRNTCRTRRQNHSRWYCDTVGKTWDTRTTTLFHRAIAVSSQTFVRYTNPLQHTILTTFRDSSMHCESCSWSSSGSTARTTDSYSKIMSVFPSKHQLSKVFASEKTERDRPLGEYL